MTTYSVRCCNYKCRHRKVIKRHPFEYKTVPKCPACGLRKGWRIEQRAYSKRNLCDCGQVVGRDGPFPHKVGTHQLCDHHPRGHYNQAKRQGVADEDLPVELLGIPMKETDANCPF